MGTPLINMDNARMRRAAVQNIVGVYESASPQTQQAGRDWYDRVNEATSKDVRGSGLTTRQGAGIVAAVSPSMDWENNNLDAVKVIKHIRGPQWRDIENGDRSVTKGTSIAQASADNLLKARRIMDGEDPDDVLNRRSAPKTNSFFHNINEPDVAGPVTIDGRAHDIAANRLQGWKEGRGIGSASLPTGKTTRYEHFENAYRSAANVLSGASPSGIILPHQVQAVTWEAGKDLERSGLTKAGKPRVKGVTRVGQPYLGAPGSGALLEGR